VAVKIKLKRLGKIHAPYYRIVVADARTKRDGRAIEEIGKYHPKSEPSLIEVSSERAQYWLSVGAQPTDPVRRLLEITGDWQKFRGEPGAEGTLRTPAPKTSRSERFAKAVGQPKADTETTPKGSRTKKSDTEAKPDGKAEKADGGARRKPRAAKSDTASKATDKTADKAAGKAAKPEKQDKADESAAAEAPQAEAPKSEAAPSEAAPSEAAEEAPQADAASSGSGD
jgi:small subunit ribosomal protein S16